jgi:hypothetical protein
VPQRSTLNYVLNERPLTVKHFSIHCSVRSRCDCMYYTHVVVRSTLAFWEVTLHIQVNVRASFLADFLLRVVLARGDRSSTFHRTYPATRHVPKDSKLHSGCCDIQPSLFALRRACVLPTLAVVGVEILGCKICNKRKVKLSL